MVHSTTRGMFSFGVALLSLLDAASATNCAPRGVPGGIDGTVASTYFAGYHAKKGFPVSSIPWDKYNIVKYAFAETTPDGSLDLSKSNPDQLPVFVKAAKEKGVKALVSIGGWTGSRFFSSSMGSDRNRTAFVKTIIDFVNKYELDGVDVDYEYPNRQGLGCNTISKDDTTYLLKTLTELRKEAPGLIITAAGSLFPWNDDKGQRSSDLAAFGDVLDFLTIMGYDFYGGWAPNAGPHTALRSDCDSRNNQGSVASGVDAWIAAKFPAKKIVLGLGFYGHGFSVNKTSALAGTPDTLQLYPAQNSTNRFKGSSWDDDPAKDDCNNVNPPSGTYPLWSLIDEQNWLDKSGNPVDSVKHTFDQCSQTPALWDPKRDIYVTYEDARSIHAKGDYIKATGLKGFDTFETGGDYHNILVDAARQAVGL